MVVVFVSNLPEIWWHANLYFQSFHYFLPFSNKMDAKLVCLLCIIVTNKWGKINKSRYEAEISAQQVEQVPTTGERAAGRDWVCYVKRAGVVPSP